MRKLYYTALSLMPIMYGYAQDVTADGMGAEFKEISSFGTHRLQSGYEGFQTYSSHNVNGTQFFLGNWYPGSVITSNNQQAGKGYVFLYDKVRQEVFIRPEKVDYVILADKEQIKSFTLSADKPHTFIQAGDYDSTMKGNFLEALVQKDNYSLFKFTSTTFEKANTNDIMKVKQGDFNDSFVDHFTYYLYHNKKLEKIELTSRSIYKVLKDDKKKVDAYYDQDPNHEVGEPFLIGLVNSLNS